MPSLAATFRASLARQMEGYKERVAASVKRERLRHGQEVMEVAWSMSFKRRWTIWSRRRPYCSQGGATLMTRNGSSKQPSSGARGVRQALAMAEPPQVRQRSGKDFRVGRLGFGQGHVPSAATLPRHRPGRSRWLRSIAVAG